MALIGVGYWRACWPVRFARRSRTPKVRIGNMKDTAGPRNGENSTQATRPAPSARNSRRSTFPSAIRATLDPPNFDWEPQAYKVINNGHTIQANAAPGSTLTVGKDKYNLTQFHFHTPSEHSLGGERSVMEVHFVHARPDGRLAVVGVFMKSGRKNAGFAAIMRAAPKSEGEKDLDKPLDPRQFLPASQSLYRYQGSLTTPPCSEVVDWNVYEQAVEVADEDIEAFKAIFPMNARPLQPLNRRFLLRGV